jgi:hypothetical protein
MNYIIEGLDRTGKGSLIHGLQETHGVKTVIHYQKPELLKFYQDRVDPIFEADPRAAALKEYQQNSFKQMFRLLNNSNDLILDRSHIGEAVYAHRYRNYNGNYVFELEYLVGGASCAKDLLILLVASNLSVLKDDGLSHDYSKRADEQADFINAFFRSAYRNKLMIDVTAIDNKGIAYYVPHESILKSVKSTIAESIGIIEKCSYTFLNGKHIEARVKL